MAVKHSEFKAASQKLNAVRDRAGRAASRIASAPTGQSPSGRLAWLAVQPNSARIKWPFGRQMTIILAACLVVLAVAVLLMIYPVLSPNGPARFVYLFHDKVVLPVRGRVFERYAPVPQLVLIGLTGLGLLAFVARNLGAEIYQATVRFWLNMTPLRPVLGAWLQQMPRDAQLWVALESEYKRIVTFWLQDPQRTNADAQRLQSVGQFLLGLPWKATELRHDVARAGIALRLAMVNHLAGSRKSRTNQVLRQPHGRYCALVAQLQTAQSNRAENRSVLNDLWDMVAPQAAQLGDPAREVILWAAWYASAQTGDSGIARHYLARVAALAFERDSKNGLSHEQDMLVFEPALTALMKRQDFRFATPGLSASQETLKGLQSKLDGKQSA